MIRRSRENSICAAPAVQTRAPSLEKRLSAGDWQVHGQKRSFYKTPMRYIFV